LYLTIRIGNSSIGFEMLLLLWMLAFIYLIIRWQLLPQGAAISSASTLFWIFFFSTSVTALVIMENKDHELSMRMRTAEKLAMQADPSSERLFNIAILSISDQFLEENFDRFREQSTNTVLKDSLVSAIFGPFFNKYETSLFTFDAQEYPLSASESLNYDTLNAFFTVQGKPTSINGLKYFETSFDQYSYIYHKEIRDRLTDSLEGHFFMLSTPRRYKSDALFPELFRQPDDFSFERSNNYAYAVYNNKDLVKHINDYDFPITIDPGSLPKEVFHSINRNGYNELWYKAAHSRTVVIAKKSNLFLEAITLFAYFFGVFLFTAGLFQFLALLIKTRFNRSRFLNEWRFSIRNQIYGTILFIGIFSFIVIGATTILFFIRRYDNNNRDRLVRTINVMSDELKNHIVSHGANNDILPDYDSASNHTLYQDIIGVSERYNADVNLYKPDGSLQISSSPLVYNKGVLSRKMDPVAFFQLNKMKRIQWIQKEEYGKLEYLSVYLPVRNPNGENYAYLNIPYFASQSDLKQEISTFLVTLINLNAFIFLLAGIIALFIANRITGSLRLIGDLMKQVNLGKRNAEIDWKSNDEVGGLVKEYNTMVKKLEDSALALAKSEREGAWREMARQVAHEIKNPLTPMKLSIQYLQKAMDQNSGQGADR
jgi:two-component system, NtrC family, nitrogen regulation sensor histidine kinase NtrY